jgi:hypothetical protein
MPELAPLGVVQLEPELPVTGPPLLLLLPLLPLQRSWSHAFSERIRVPDDA